MENTEPVWIESLSKSIKNLGRPYYYNIITKESFWEKPEGVVIKLLKDTHKTSPSVGKPDGSTMKPVENYKPSLPSNQKSNNDDDGDYDDLDNVFARLKPKSINEEKATSQDRLLLQGSNPKVIKSPDKKPTLLHSLDNGSTSSESNKSSPTFKRNTKRISKTPIQDRYEQQKRGLIENHKRKYSDENEGIDVKRKPVHERIGHPTIENTMTQESRKRLRIEDQPIAKEAPQTKRSPVFDLRDVLNSTRIAREHNASSEYEMEWETVKSDHVDPQPQETVGISGEKARTSPSKVNDGKYKRIYLVFDTCSLCNDTYFVEQILKKGKFLGLPEVVILIPFGVINELDKLKTREPIAASARKISRIISYATQQSSERETSEREVLKTLRLQDGSKSREPCCGLKLESTDDLVLNCCLQQRESCTKDELPVLITEDINLGNKAKSFKLITHNLISLKKWTRSQIYTEDQLKNSIQGSKEHVPEQIDEMEVDFAEQISNNSPVPVKRRSSGEDSELLNKALQNCAKSYADDAKVEYQLYMQGIIDDAVKAHYEEFKKFSTVSKPSWSIFDCITNLRRRWFAIMDSYPTSDHQRLLQQLVVLFKKTNMHGSSSVLLTTVDMSNMFTFGTKLGQIFCEKYKSKTDIFLERLNIIEKDWNDERLKFESTLKCTEDTEDSNCDRVDVAIQHTLSCFRSEYDNLQQAKCSTSEEWLSLYSRASNFSCSLQDVIHRKCEFSIFINLLEKKGFPDLTAENVNEFLMEESLRTKAVTISKKLIKLLLLIDSSIEDL